MSDGRQSHGLPAIRSEAASDRVILERITDAFFALDAEWRFTYCNDRAEEMLDRSREELIGRVIWDEFPETVETQFPEGFHQAMETQEPVAFEVYHRPLSTWFEARAYPSGSGLTVSLRDVTDRKDRERDLERFETMVETIHDGVVTLDANDQIQFVNRAVERTFGVNRDAIVGRNITALPNIVDIETSGFSDLGHSLDKIRRGDADHSRFEFTYTNRNGEERIAETRMVQLGDGEIAGIVRDVTEQREYERVVRSLHSITPQLLGAQNRLEICSIAVHAAGEVLDLRISGIWLLEEGLNRLDPVAGTAGAHEELGGLPHFPHGEGLVWKAFREGDPQLYEDVGAETVDDPTPLRSEIVVPIGEHGVLMAGETRPEALDATDLELATILAANTEAALDREEREGLLRRSKDTLVRQNERLEVVETVLSTDLRDQLAIAARKAQAANAGDVIEPLMRARRLADDALELSKGEFSVGPRGAVEVGEVARTASEVVDGVTVEIVQGAWIRADRERLVRLFETLFLDARNRARSAETGTDDVIVELGIADQSTLYLDDDAPALPEDEWDHAFDLHQAADPGHRNEPGDDDSGLGLAVGGEIATAHGWDITVTTGPNGSVRFEIGDITTLESAE